ncbi:MAG: ribosome biogenesis GTPase Der [Parcubacteria group bacterium]|nr:ribosome biogenesis GTPase Der [Parcubacteria group bacterium]
MELPRVVIVGRSNVGKSTLFNAVAGAQRALVLPEAGTTRDVLETRVHWRGRAFTLVDTGGLDPGKRDTYREAIIAHSLAAQKQAAMILFLVDVAVGPMDEEARIAKCLRTLGVPVLLAINKCDNAQRRRHAAAFARFNLPSFQISASNGSGIGDLLDAVVEKLPESPESGDAAAPSDVTLALIGKPNVGKSSLLNSIAGFERMIVSEIPHTTRDSQDVAIAYGGKTYTVIDTAGIRRKTGEGDAVERLSINKSMSAIQRSDVAALVVDISEKLTSQDHRLAREIEDAHCGLFIVANKWDQIPEKDSATIARYTEYLASELPNLSWVPIIFTSAVDGKRTKEMLSLAADIKENLDRSITDNALSKFLKMIVAKRKPTIGKGTRRPRLLSLKQVSHNPPSFVLEIPTKTDLAQSYQKYLTNSLREKFDFEGVPIKLTVQTVIPTEPKASGGISPKLRRDERPRKKRMTHRPHHY